jgi:hypothetical protein
MAKRSLNLEQLSGALLSNTHYDAPASRDQMYFDVIIPELERQSDTPTVRKGREDDVRSQRDDYFAYLRKQATTGGVIDPVAFAWYDALRFRNTLDAPHKAIYDVVLRHNGAGVSKRNHI